MHVNLLAVVVAAVAAMAVGMVWYSPGVFGKMWMGLIGMSEKDLEAAKKKGMAPTMVAALISQLVLACVLARFMSGMDMYSVSGGVQTAAWAWFGFVATIMLGMVLWEKRPLKLYFLNAAHWLVAMVVMGAVLGHMG